MATEVRMSTPDEHERILGFIDDLREFAQEHTAIEGDQSLLAMAMVVVAGQTAGRCSPDVRGAAVEHLQDWLMKAARSVNQPPPHEPAQG